ncbi:MAG: DUF2064 domain-containing protein [Acidobacteriota bacterium]
MTGSRSCVLLFARSPRDEGRAKHIARSNRLFELIRRRMAIAASGAGADLVETVSDRSMQGGHLLLQRGATFADRLQNALTDVRSMGYERVLAVPVDVPQITAADLVAAFEHLDVHDHVLGPSVDGGVYLIGSRIDEESLTAGISWNTSEVFEQLRARAPSAAIMRTLRDLDVGDDLSPLLEDCLSDAGVARILRQLISAPILREFLRKPAKLAGFIPHRSGRDPPSATS